VEISVSPARPTPIAQRNARARALCIALWLLGCSGGGDPASRVVLDPGPMQGFSPAADGRVLAVDRHTVYVVIDVRTREVLANCLLFGRTARRRG
jgi:hypothetical protein